MIDIMESLEEDINSGVLFKHSLFNI